MRECGKILLAEPDESVRRMITRVLETAGYEVVMAADGAEAMMQALNGVIDLLLVDLELANPTAWQVIELVRAREARMPVVLLTAWPNQAEEAKRRGADALMEKPLDLPLLLSCVWQLLERHPGEASKADEGEEAWPQVRARGRRG